jgi:hypothetical protein
MCRPDFPTEQTSPRSLQRQADHIQRAEGLTSPTLRRVPAHPIHPLHVPPIMPPPLLAGPQRTRVADGRLCSRCKVPQALDVFRTFSTCDACRESSRQQRARAQAQAQQAQQRGADQQVAGELNAEEHETLRGAAPVPLAPTTSALPPAHISFLKDFAQTMSNMQREYCPSCHERWFDLKVRDGKCSHCRSPKYPSKYTAANNMDPGPGPPPGLPSLTRIEEMMISPVHCFVQVCTALVSLHCTDV